MIECPEFRSLLLYLREDLTDDDICGRDKLRSSIMEAWYNYYLVLKDELEVLAFSFSIINFANNVTGGLGENLFYGRRLELC